MQFKVCIATGRTDADGRPQWRECGQAYDQPQGKLRVTATTPMGTLAYLLRQVDTPKANGPSHIVSMMGFDKAWDMGVAYRNQHGGYNLVMDSPAGEYRLFLFPANMVNASAA